jgi:chromosome partitioning protein
MASALAGQGRRVLVVDADTQANATHVLLDGSPPRPPTLSEVLTGDADADSAVVPSAFNGVDLIPANAGLADVNVALAAEVGRERRLRVALEGITRRYDAMLVDTGPTRSLLTTNVLNAVAEVLVPVAPGLFGFLGIVQLREDVQLVRRYLENKALDVTGIFVVMTERTKVSLDFERQLREAFGGLVLKTTVPRAVAFEEATARRVSVFTHAPKSAGAAAYKTLVREVFGHGGKAKRPQPSDGHPDAHHDADAA